MYEVGVVGVSVVFEGFFSDCKKCRVTEFINMYPDSPDPKAPNMTYGALNGASTKAIWKLLWKKIE